MYRLFLTFCFSLILSLSILTPAVVSLIDINKDKIHLEDFCEKDNKTEKEIEEKELTIHSLFDYQIQFKKTSNGLFSHYLEGTSSFYCAILLPPPEHQA